MAILDYGLAFMFYASVVVFIFRVISMCLIWLRGNRGQALHWRSRFGLKLAFKIPLEIVTLVRLLKANEWLWIGQWLMHVSLLFIFVRHLRYILEPTPEFVIAMQRAGIIGGYVLFFALIYIVVVKVFVQQKAYLSGYNIFLLTLLFILSITGLLMKTQQYTDVVDVKLFMLGLLLFKPQTAPDSAIFMVHFTAFCILLASLPTHILAAPQSIAEAVKRDEAISP